MKMSRSSVLLLIAIACISSAGAFRQPVVFPPLDASKYEDASAHELPEQRIIATDSAVPEENHEHADDRPATAPHEELPRSNETRGEPIALAQRSSTIRIKAPEHSLAVWNSDGTICILARFQATFEIPYATASGKKYASIKMPPNRELATRGVCPTESREPLFEVQWPLFKFIMHFARIHSPSSWYVNKIEVQYNTNSPLFPGALNPGRRYASATQNISLFKTPMGQSYGCPLYPPLVLTHQNSSSEIRVKLRDIRLQAYQLTGNYGPLSRCQQVAMAHTLDPYNYDRTVPVAVGSTLAGVSLATIVGYALYRSMFATKVDYGNIR
ncbi:lysosome-associated membrane glycoprotein 5 [Galendromus occidentalis]|uniref:Lysosome-associated membrane glycoprotein 5 n=1 Tax=Galendromus occidentalis TaxID=34638 RepID=A0AAJ7SE96_9ACAR|nr:lysosome-associated membrane glycoprotein 5 [Galendromus occidentalis]